MNRIFALLPALLLAGCFSQAPAPSVDRGPTAQAKAPAAPAAAPAGPGYYTVKRGDTLYRIALEHGQDYRDVAAWNNLTSSATIKEGQVLRVAPPGAADGGTAVAKPIGVGAAVEAKSLDKPAASVASDGLRREPRANKEPYSDEAYARLTQGNGAAAKPAEAKPEAKPEAKAEVPAAVAPAGPDDVVWAWPSAGKLLASFTDSNGKGIDLGGKAGDPVLAAADGKVLYAGTAIKGYGNLVIIGHKGGFNSVYAHNRKVLVEEKQLVTKGQKIAEMGNSDSDAVKLHFEVRKQGRPVDPMTYLPKR